MISQGLRSLRVLFQINLGKFSIWTQFHFSMPQDTCYKYLLAEYLYIIAVEFQEELLLGSVQRRNTNSIRIRYSSSCLLAFKTKFFPLNLPHQSKILPIWSRKPIFKVLLHLTVGENNLSPSLRLKKLFERNFFIAIEFGKPGVDPNKLCFFSISNFCC